MRTKKDDDSTELSAGIPALMFPVFLIMLAIRYPVSLVVIVPVLAWMYISQPVNPPKQQAPPVPVQVLAPAAPTPTTTVPPPPPPPPSVPPAAPEPSARYRVQVGAFESCERAVKLKDEVAILYADVVVDPPCGDATLHRVYVGPFDDRPSAQQVADRLQSEGLSPLIVSVD